MSLQPFTLVPATRSVGSVNPPGDMNNTSLQLLAMGGAYNALNSAYAGGADPAGISDSTAALTAATGVAQAAGRPLYVPGGNYKLTSALNWMVPGLRVITDGAANTVFEQTTANTPVVQFAGEGQRIDGLTLRYASQQSSSNTSAICATFGDDTVGDSFLSRFEDLRCWLGATSMAINPAITTKAGLFSCYFGNVECFGYSAGAINFVGGNGTGAGGTGCVMDNTYIHNNFSGSDANSTSHVVNIQNFQEFVFNQLNIEHAECFDSPPLQFAEVGNIVINGLHIEHIELSGTSPGWGLVGVGTQTGCVTINGYSVRFCTFTGSTSNAMIQVTGSAGQQTVIVNGFSMPSSDGGNSTPTLALVDFASQANVTITVSGVATSPAGPLVSQTAINAGTSSQLVILNGSQVTYSPAVAWTSFATGGMGNGLNVTSGFSVTPVAGTWYYADLYVPFTTTVTGIIAPNETASATDKWMVAVWPAAGGTALANSSTSGLTVPATAENFKIAFTAPVTLPGPAVYKVALQSNGTTDHFEAFGNNVEGFVAGSQAGAFGTVPTLTPGASYTQNTGPMLKTY